MKTSLVPMLLAIIMFVGCSKDDKPKCDSCTVVGQKVEFCDNEDGTFSVSAGGEKETYTLEELEEEGISNLAELKAYICSADKVF